MASLANVLPQGSTRRRVDPERWVPRFVFVAVLLLVATPLCLIVYQSLIDRPLYDGHGVLTSQNYSGLLTSRAFLDAAANSFYLAVVSTVVATVVGVLGAFCFTRLELPGQRWLRGVMALPVYLSQLVLAFGWYVLYGPSGYVTLAVQRWLSDTPWNLYSILGMGVLAGVSQAPYVTVLCSSALSLSNGSLEDAARTTGARSWRVMTTITLPLMRPSIFYSALLAFVGGLELLSIPLIFGAPSNLEFFTTFLYREALGQTSPNYGMLGAAAVYMLICVALLVIVQQRMLGNTQRFVTLRGKAQRHRATRVGGWRFVIAALWWLYLAISVLLPIAGLVARSAVQFLSPLVSPLDYLTASNYQQLFTQSEYWHAITNSLFVAGIGAALATAFVALVVLCVQRSNFRWRRSLEVLCLAPRAVPGIVVGIGFLWLTLWLPGMGVLYGTLWLLIIAFSMRNLPTAFAAMAPTFMQIGRELDQASRACGATWWQTSRNIVLPLGRRAMASSYLLLFVSFLKEYAAAVFLVAPTSQVIGPTMLRLWTNGDFGPVAALSIVQLLLTLALVMVAKTLGKGK